MNGNLQEEPGKAHFRKFHHACTMREELGHI